MGSPAARRCLARGIGEPAEAKLCQGDGPVVQLGDPRAFRPVVVEVRGKYRIFPRDAFVRRPRQQRAKERVGGRMHTRFPPPRVIERSQPVATVQNGNGWMRYISVGIPVNE